MVRCASTMKWNSREGCVFLLVPVFLLLSPSLLPIHGTELLNHVPESGICQSMDIRNNVNELYKHLNDCQVIEGSLQILLIENENEIDFAGVSFPKLVEITGYLLLFRVIGLRSVGQLFPNLAVIRGQHLFAASKALVIYEMASLQDIGLHSLTRIMNGYVHIEKNPSLCFVHSIDWNKIINATENDVALVPRIKSDKPQNECPVCPMSVNGVDCPRSEKDNNKFLCWNRNHCQKICSNCPKSSCNDKGECCDEHCVGGCGKDVTKCNACRDFVFSTNNSSKCVQSCPSNFLAYLNRRCITHHECVNMTRPILIQDTESDLNNDIQNPFMVHEGECVLDCPATYSLNYTDHTCVKCNNTCKKECKGGRIDSIYLSSEFKGCTHITGSIEIQIRGGSQVVKALEENLGMIEEIEGYLKVVRSYSLVSLNFLKSLKYIRGKQLENHRYSLIALDNQNLQDLFDWDTHKEFRIFNGSLYFHFNSKLCLEKIEELRRKAQLPPYKETEVATNSNGDKVACNISKLEVIVTKIYSKSVVLEWSPFEVDDARKLLSYIVSSIEAPNKTVNFFDGRDACGQDNWHVDDVPNNPDTERINHTLSNLKPFTQYAFFVKTYTIASEKNGAQSEIIYFKTKAAQPSIIKNVVSDAKTNNSLSIKWSKPKNPNGMLSYYIVTGRKQPMTPISEKDRDYCRETIVPEAPKKLPSPPSKTKPQECSNSEGMGSKMPEIDEEDREDRIDFENALHNKVYVKRPKNGGRTRRDIMFTAKDSFNETFPEYGRDIPSYVYNDNGTLSPEIEKIIYLNTTEKGTQFWETFTYFVQEPATSLKIDRLHHFTGYNIEVRACRQKEENDAEPQCGDYSNGGEFKTSEKPGADNIHNVSILNTTSDSVTVRWALPPDPNRKIVSVTIHYRREGTKNSQYLGECIPFKDFNFTKDGQMIEYTIPRLFPGNHSLYLRATSLFGVGDRSPILSFYIPESGPDTVLIVALVLTFLFMGIFGALWWFYRRTMRERYLMRLIPSVNPDYMPSVYVVDEWEVPRKNVDLIKELGQGSFGMVWEGFGHDFKDVKGTLRCAVKTVNEHATRRERIDFLNEASVMKAFNTSHVVKLLGVVSQGQPALVIMELMVNGDLKTYLRSHRPENNDGKLPPTLKQILQMAIEIADGMAYLESKKFVHRDLAARNCMVAEDLTVKIGDFGMTRDIYETDYYRKGTRGLLPVRWMSPESLKDGVFSSSSDVWSYGVVLWEMATLASQPYQGLSNEQVLRYIMEGGLMERPENCPDKLYEIMKICWELKAIKRPTFMKLCEILLPDANERFMKISFYHGEEGSEARAIRAAAKASAEITVEDVGEDVEIDASTPLNALPSDVRIAGPYGMSNSDRSESIQSVHIDPNPRFYSISEEHTANGYITGSRIKNGKAQSQC